MELGVLLNSSCNAVDIALGRIDAVTSKHQAQVEYAINRNVHISIIYNAVRNVRWLSA